jgi:four helix bundle protein
MEFNSKSHLRRLNMSKIKKLEDIESWKSARRLTKQIYEITAAGEFTRDFGLKDQIRRASVSTLSNIAEGFERGGDQEFLQFLSVAKGSCGEVRAQLYVALDQGYLSAETFETLSKNRLGSWSVDFGANEVLEAIEPSRE